MTDEMSKAQGPSSRFGTDTPEQEAMRKIFFPNYPSQEQQGKFFQALGLAITVWQLVESALYQVYERAIAPFRPNACAAGFHAMQTFSLKLSVTDAAVRSCLAEDPESIEEWSKTKEEPRR
jgi:hypothetical protein